MTGLYDDFEFIEVSVADRVATATFNGDGPGNTMTFDGQGELVELLPRVDRDDDVDVLVLTGADEAFCAGGTREFAARLSAGSDPAMVRVAMQRVHRNVVNAVEFQKILISAMNGPSGGAPLVLATLADVVIAERHVTFADHHVRAAVAAGDGNVLIWPMAMGLLRAKRYLLLSEDLSADQAEQLGLVTEVVDVGAALARAREYAARFVGLPAPALRATKQALNQWLRQAMPVFEKAWSAEVVTLVQGTAES